MLNFPPRSLLCLTRILYDPVSLWGTAFIEIPRRVDAVRRDDNTVPIAIDNLHI